MTTEFQKLFARAKTERVQLALIETLGRGKPAERRWGKLDEAKRFLEQQFSRKPAGREAVRVALQMGQSFSRGTILRALKQVTFADDAAWVATTG